MKKSLENPLLMFVLLLIVCTIIGVFLSYVTPNHEELTLRGRIYSSIPVVLPVALGGTIGWIIGLKRRKNRGE